MKKWIMGCILIILCCMGACGNSELETDDNEYPINEVSDKSDSDDNTEVDANNRTIIAEVLGVEENHREIRFILSSLNTIGAGQIQSAEVAEVNDIGEKIINVVAEDGTDYQIYLSGSLSVEAVKNLSTGEWPIQSTR